jgi:hypothetical protein
LAAFPDAVFIVARLLYRIWGGSVKFTLLASTTTRKAGGLNSRPQAGKVKARRCFSGCY